MSFAERGEHLERHPVEAERPWSEAFREIAGQLDRIQLDFTKEH
jgi:hypothetical protein